MTSPSLTRRKIRFEGRVQGVGFRYTTVQLAQDLPLRGTVQNLDDGRVELVLEGNIHDINTLLHRLHEHFSSYIRKVEQSSLPPLGFPKPGVHIVS